MHLLVCELRRIQNARCNDENIVNIILSREKIMTLLIYLIQFVPTYALVYMNIILHTQLHL